MITAEVNLSKHRNIYVNDTRLLAEISKLENSKLREIFKCFSLSDDGPTTLWFVRKYEATTYKLSSGNSNKKCSTTSPPTQTQSR
ncbi:hypothetical protein Peur_032336 [Populus x canadensis]